MYRSHWWLSWYVVTTTVAILTVPVLAFYISGVTLADVELSEVCKGKRLWNVRIGYCH